MQSLRLQLLALGSSALLANACSDAHAATPPAGGTGGQGGALTPETHEYLEVATQVTAASLGGLLRLDGPAVESGVGSMLLLNSQLVEGGAFVSEGAPGHVEGGSVVGTMHGACTNVGGGLSLSAEGAPGRVGKCEQALNVYDRGQIVVNGLIEQDRFEAGETQTLAVTGGTGAYRGAYGELTVTQLTFPGIVKRLGLTLYIP